VTANGSSSSAANPAEAPPAAAALQVELVGSGLLPPLPEALLAGDDRDLVAPLEFLAPGELPAAPAAPAPDRRRLAEALRSANRAYGHPAADRLAGRLADPEVRVVVAGQQPGLLGGPLYTFSKMLAVSRWAAALEAAGQPAVPVFWVATEDHDFREVSNVTILTHDGPRRFELGDDPSPLAPLGTRTLGPGVSAVLAGLAEAMPGDRYGDWLDEVGRWYRPDARFGEAFCRLMAHLLGERCPLLLDSMLPELKAAERPWLERLVERRRAVDEAAAAADRRIQQRGYPLQVSPQPGAAPLFLLHRGERRRIEWDGGGFRLRGPGEAGGTVDELAAVVRDNPAVVSPGVLARPAIQDAVLGTCLQVLGPGEMSYIPQAAAVYEVLGAPAPAVALRPQVLVLEAHQVEQIAEMGLALGELLGDRSRLDHLLAGRAGSDPRAADGELRRRLAELLDQVEEPALAVDPNLERPWEKTREAVERSLDRFSDKLAAAAARRDEVRAQRVERLRDTLLPGGTLQERVVSTAHYPGKYRQRFVDGYWQQMELDGGRLQVVTP
jgi:bacillithiol biosynthesis cysteine-adding enzyme BshC